MTENKSVKSAFCIRCLKDTNFVLQSDGKWQCPNCNSYLEGELLNKVVFISARFKSHGSSEIDGERLTSELRVEVQQLNSDGYEIVSLTPVTSGFRDFKYETGAYGYSYGYGYSFTEGIIIVARKV